MIIIIISYIVEVKYNLDMRKRKKNGIFMGIYGIQCFFSI